MAFALTSDRPRVDRCVRPIEFEEPAGGTEHAHAVTAFPLPGHFPGHMRLRVESARERALLIGDAPVHPMLLDPPDAEHVSDLDPAESAATRRALVPQPVDEDLLLVCGHCPAGGIGHVVTPASRVLWEAA